MNQNASSYPVQLWVDYSNKLSRITTLFRLILALPLFVVLAFISTGLYMVLPTSAVSIEGMGLLFFAPMLLILFRNKYPRWWFDWNVQWVNFSYRCFFYLACLTDKYPSTDEEQNVHIDIPYPDTLNRGLPLIKWLLAIPHYIVLVFLNILKILFIVLGWFSVLVIGRYPKPLFNYIVHVTRWELRVLCYAVLLSTDQYPPFSLAE